MSMAWLCSVSAQNSAVTATWPAEVLWSLKMSGNINMSSVLHLPQKAENTKTYPWRYHGFCAFCASQSREYQNLLQHCYGVFLVLEYSQIYPTVFCPKDLGSQNHRCLPHVFCSKFGNEDFMFCFSLALSKNSRHLHMFEKTLQYQRMVLSWFCSKQHACTSMDWVLKFTPRNFMFSVLPLPLPQKAKNTETHHRWDHGACQIFDKTLNHLTLFCLKDLTKYTKVGATTSMCSAQKYPHWLDVLFLPCSLSKSFFLCSNVSQKLFHTTKWFCSVLLKILRTCLMFCLSLALSQNLSCFVQMSSKKYFVQPNGSTLFCFCSNQTLTLLWETGASISKQGSDLWWNESRNGHSKMYMSSVLSLSKK